jgi:hypothetical protein
LMDQEMMGYDWNIRRLRAAHPNVTFPPQNHLRNRGRADEFNLKVLFDLNYGLWGLYIVDPKAGDDSFEGAYQLVPHGVVHKVVSVGDAAEIDPLEYYARAVALEGGGGLPDLSSGAVGPMREEMWEEVVGAEGRNWRLRVSTFLSRRGLGEGGEGRYLWLVAAHAYNLRLVDEALRRGEWELLKNVGIVGETLWREFGCATKAATLAAFGGYAKAAEGKDVEVLRVRKLMAELKRKSDGVHDCGLDE